jgi:hypothetical protein
MTNQVPAGEMPETETETVPVPVTEEPFDKDRAMETIKKLRESEKVARKDRQELEHLRQLENERKQAELSETDRLKAQLDEKEAKLRDLTKKDMQREAASTAELPAIFADRIRGETLEDMIADAKTLLGAMPKVKAAPNLGATNPGQTATTGETDAQKRDRLLHGESFDVFAKGGGINYPGG